ncbi:HNH endonuclease [Paenibacillus sp. TAF58]
MTMNNETKKPTDRIKYNINENGCYICTSHAKNAWGYPLINIKKKSKYVHRVIYEEHHGKLTSEQIVRHKCDIRDCINPLHLIVGTHQDNVEDRVKRGRSAYGTLNGRAKLCEDDVKEIRSETNSTNTELARRFNVDRKVIYNVKLQKTWKHVN